MIDIDRMDEQLVSALTVGPSRVQRSPAPVPAPASPRRKAPVEAPPRRQAAVTNAPPPRQTPGQAPATAPELLELGLLAEADAVMAASSHPRDALTWTMMRALLDGRQDAARKGVEEMRRLAERTDDVEATERYWVQRFWVAFEWGTDEERLDVLDHCRTRAYRFDDLPWWGNLALLLAVMGKVEEAARAMDEAQALLTRVPGDNRWLDAVTNLIDAAVELGDAGRVVALSYSVRWPEGRLVVVGPGVVCKGSMDRYRALSLAAAGRPKDARECFRRAESVHRSLGAAPLLARTLQQAPRTLVAA